MASQVAQNQPPIPPSTIEYRNGIYFGELKPNSHNIRHGFGLLITDDSEVLLAQWKNNQIHGHYFFTNWSVYAYGTIHNRQYQGFNAFVDAQITLFSNCVNNLLQGNAFIKYAGVDKHEICQYTAGKRSKQPILNSSVDPQDLFKDVPIFLPDFLEKMINKHNVRTPFGMIDLNKFTYYGQVDQGKSLAQGLGFVLSADMMFSCGTYQRNELHGLGRCNLVSEVLDGVFRDGQLNGVGIKWNPRRQEFVHGNFDDKGVNIISRGQKYPTAQIRSIRSQFHLRSIHFNNDWVVMERLINVDLSLLRSDSLQKYLTEVRSQQVQPIVRVLHQHFPLEGYVNEFALIKKQTRIKSGSKSPGKLTRSSNTSRKSPARVVTYNQEQRNDADIRLQQAFQSIRLEDQGNLNRYEDQFESAIREYEYLTNMTNGKKAKRNGQISRRTKASRMIFL